MQYLHLHTLDETYSTTASLRPNPLINRESLRRLAWAVFYQDTMVDAGRHGVHLVSDTSFRIQLPCDETSFIRGITVRTATLDSLNVDACLSSTESTSDSAGLRSTLGIGANLLRTAAVRRRLLHFNSLIRSSTQSTQQMMELIDQSEKELMRMIVDIPSDITYTENNVFIHAAERTAFVSMHLLRHNCFIILSMARINVCSADPTMTPRTLDYRRDRIHHAIPVSRIVADILRLGVNCDQCMLTQAYTALESASYVATSLTRPSIAL